MHRLAILEIDSAWEEDRCNDALKHLPEAVVKRALRYRTHEARQNLIASQVALREALVNLDEEPDRLDICPHGRPYLRDSSLQFNLSHSEARVVIAFARDSRLQQSLGVDVEWVHRRVERDALAKRFFAPAEHAFTLNSAENFFRVWTRKEAVLKTNGIGLRVELSSFEVLGNTVAQEITGRPLTLGTESRDHGYMVSWAVAQDWEPYQVKWLDYNDPSWAVQLREGIDG